ncbi:DUF4389 domain-containing protein [Nocardioides sp.]|uniref:DUF4389 domain-containing protein n=1 Tax=Nocardioides sp. TaxID=35761 RepID=UPI001A309581|nr:DUF4389 domain-containing protein [Nocardioides sp.]MBJ7356275.1 DUF4389 domain-containing protein [Nocardioides sp.]
MTAPTYPSTYPPTHPSSYPVHVDAHLEAGLNRWLWLVKWLLAIPHYIVLAFLWLAFVVLSVVAFFAILFTGRYPRAIFDFNVGVLRWSWRVAYYAYGALGTDRYPPFTLDEVPDYPAHLEVEYPEHLSRGLVLVKSWLLAIPHYLVVGFFLGGGWYLGSEAVDDRDGNLLWNSGLISLLVFVAAVVLLFTGRYPQPIFDLVLGLNRWVIRVAAYASLMTDDYPPFRLDQGGADPGDGRLELSATGAQAPTVPPGPPGAPGVVAPPPPPRAAPRRGWTAGRVIALVAGCLLLLLSLGLGAAGGMAAYADQVARDDAGFVMSDEELLTTDTYALVSDQITIHTDSSTADLPESILGDAKIEATSTGGEPLFVGVARTAAVEDYLDGVRQAEVVDLDSTDGGGLDPEYLVTGQDAPNVPPTELDVWSAQATGSGTVSVVWPVEDGDWTVVVMNADGSADVTADVAVGATLDWLGWLAVALLVAAAVGLLLSALTMTLAVRGARSGSPS